MIIWLRREKTGMESHQVVDSTQSSCLICKVTGRYLARNRTHHRVPLRFLCFDSFNMV